MAIYRRRAHADHPSEAIDDICWKIKQVTRRLLSLHQQAAGACAV